MPDKCREKFLDGVTDVYVYPSDKSVLPLPFSVAKIPAMERCSFAEPLLHVATSGENYVTADGITVKQTLAEGGNGTVYTFDISVNIEHGADNIAEIHKNLVQKDCLVVLRQYDGTLLLCYTLPGTFAFSTSETKTVNDSQRTIAVNTKSMSDFIPITLLE